MENQVLKGHISNYKFFFTGSNTGHYFEITTDSDESYYVQSETGIAVVDFGTDVQVGHSHMRDIICGHLLIVPCKPIQGPFKRTVNVINYKGRIVECLDYEFGIYNLDNEILVFGCGYLDFQVSEEVILYNFHLIKNDPMISSTFTNLGTLTKAPILVYCPSFSSFVVENAQIAYDNFIRSNSDFSSLLAAHYWRKANNIPIPPCRFEKLDELASSLTGTLNSSQFMNHCHDCTFTTFLRNYYSATELSKKHIITTHSVENAFRQIRNDLKSKHTCNNIIPSRLTSYDQFILKGKIEKNQKNIHFYEIKSEDGCRVPIFCDDILFDPPDGIDVMIFNFYSVVELIPFAWRKHAKPWGTQAYIWLTQRSSLWSPEYYWKESNNSYLDLIQNGFVLCEIIRKHLVRNEHDGKEITVILTHSSKGFRSFNLLSSHRSYCILPANDKSPVDSDDFSPRVLIHEKAFPSSPVISINEYLPLDFIKPVLYCTLNTVIRKKGAAQVRVSDLQFLPYVVGIQFFSLRLRIISVFSVTFKLFCSQCNSFVISVHSHEKGLNAAANTEMYKIYTKVVFNVMDIDEDSRTNTTYLFINRFSHLSEIMSWTPDTKQKIISYLFYTPSGEFNATSDDFKGINPIPQNSCLIFELFRKSPYRNHLIAYTFPTNMAQKGLVPVCFEFCVVNMEMLLLINRIKLKNNINI